MEWEYSQEKELELHNLAGVVKKELELEKGQDFQRRKTEEEEETGVVMKE